MSASSFDEYFDPRMSTFARVFASTSCFTTAQTEVNTIGALITYILPRRSG